ncbi:MAG: peptidase T, partial [Spirochaetales bacterium]
MINSSPVPQAMEQDRRWFENDLLDRFLRYARIHTTSDRHGVTSPTTQHQFDLARVLEADLRAIGVENVVTDDLCHVIARIPGNSAGTPIGYMAHMDTAPDFSGEHVNPQVHENYDGGIIALGAQHALDPTEYPLLSRYAGETVITTDGTTLLGSDDKAGIAEI